MSELQNNPDLFAKDGVIGRMDYFINGFKVLGLGLLACIPFALGSLINPVTAVLGGLCTAACFIPVVYFAFLNHFKRLRDIRGKTQDETNYQIILCVVMIVPYVGVIASLALLFAEGVVTGNGKGLGHVEESISNTVTNIRPKESESQKIENLAKLHKLKESGAITEEEFNKYKDDALKKIAS
jgi:hypothetical protein